VKANVNSHLRPCRLGRPRFLFVAPIERFMICGTTKASRLKACSFPLGSDPTLREVVTYAALRIAYDCAAPAFNPSLPPLLFAERTRSRSLAAQRRDDRASARDRPSRSRSLCTRASQRGRSNGNTSLSATARSPPRLSRSMRRARCSLVFTVSSRIPSSFAVSFVLISSTSRKTKMMRNAAGSLSTSSSSIFRIWAWATARSGSRSRAVSEDEWIGRDVRSCAACHRRLRR
jgi:hypothetical protein